MAGKSTKVPYPGDKRQNMIPDGLEVGDELHSDQIGPITPVSRYGNRYVIEFIDASS
jgi:hypothetical protein